MNKKDNQISFKAFMFLCCILTILLCAIDYRGVIDWAPWVLALPIIIPGIVTGIVYLIMGNWGGEE